VTLQATLVAYQLRGSYGISSRKVAYLEADVRGRQLLADKRPTAKPSDRSSSAYDSWAQHSVRRLTGKAII